MESVKDAISFSFKYGQDKFKFIFDKKVFNTIKTYLGDVNSLVTTAHMHKDGGYYFSLEVQDQNKRTLYRHENQFDLFEDLEIAGKAGKVVAEEIFKS